MAELTADWEPPGFPAHVAIAGRWVRLEPLDPAQHGDDLVAAFRNADALWEFLPPQPPTNDAELTAIVTEVAARAGVCAYAVRNLADGRALGFLTIMEIRPERFPIRRNRLIDQNSLKRNKTGVFPDPH